MNKADVRRRRSFRFDARGGAAIEFSFTAPMYFLMLIGLLQVGVWLYADIALQHGAEAAARCGALKLSTCQSTSTVAAYASAHTTGIAVPSSTFQPNPNASCGYQVAASYSIVSFTKGQGLPSITVRASACYPA